MPNIKLSDAERKSDYISIKCTRKQKAELTAMAQKNGKSVSEYLLDSGLAGKERIRAKDRKQAAGLVRQQEYHNMIYRQAIANGDSELKQTIIFMGEETEKTWGF
ncbi:MAG: plasmid mobilization protein [Lachnospiraceae bacterium]